MYVKNIKIKGMFGVAKIGVLAFCLVLIALLSVAYVMPTFAKDGSYVWTMDMNGNYRSDFEPEDTVYIHGSGFASNKNVSIDVKRPDKKVESGVSITDLEGYFVYTYDLDGIQGEYLVKVTDGVNSAQTTFNDSVQNSQCVCGDGHIDPGEVCDDGNTQNGDGCNSSCKVENGWTCTGEPSICTVDNPELENSCGIDIALVIDSSGSIGPNELSQMKTAFHGFVDAFLPNTPTQMSVTDFDDTARILQTFTNDINDIKDAINTPASGGCTNWEDALIKAHSTFDPRPDKPDLVIFASDGNPNTIVGSNPCGVNEQTAVHKAIDAANAIKLDGIRIITLGIGNDLNPNNLKAISSEDAYYDSDFNQLAQTLAQLAQDLCGGTVTVRKYVDGAPTNGWTFNASVTGGTSNPPSGQTADGGYIVFDIGIDNAVAYVNIAETLQGGYSFVNASCNDGHSTPGIGMVTGIKVDMNDSVYCEFHNTAHECERDEDCAHLNNPPCYLGVCNQNYQCEQIFVDNEGPVTSNVEVIPSYNNGLFNLSAKATDECSNIKTSEYFLGFDDNTAGCGEPGTGTLLSAKDGSFDELIEDLFKKNVQFPTDGLNWACVQSEDVSNNWGNCQCAWFETDSFPPSCPFDIMLDNQLYPNEYLVCGNNPWLNATVCDTQSNIQGGEFFIDVQMPPIPQPWTGIWMDPLRQFMIGSQRCAVIGALVNTSKLGEGTHYIKLRGKDIVENWGKILECGNVSFVRDTTAPQTDKTINPYEGKIVQCYGSETHELPQGVNMTNGCYYVKQGTSITLHATDPDPQGTGEFAGNVVIHYKVWYKQNSGDNWQILEQGTGEVDKNVTINLNQDSYHLIEYWSVDLCGLEENHHYELDIVDTKSPVTTKTIEGSQIPGDGFTWITGSTTIKLNCTDQQPHPVNNVALHWRYNVDGGQWNGWYSGGSYVEINFREDSVHTLEWYCTDALGNTEATQSEIDKVDSTPPTTNKTYGTPYYTDGNREWINSDTMVYLSAEDGGQICHVDDTTSYWMNTLVDEHYCQDPKTYCYPTHNYNDKWNIYDGPFQKKEQSCHMIEYWSEDALGNKEAIKAQCVYVDNTAPHTEKIVGNPKYPGEGDVDWWITQGTTITLNCSDVIPHPVGHVTLYWRDYLEIQTPPEFTEEKDGYAEIRKNEDCRHILEWYCEDILGNSEGTKEKPVKEIDQVDTAPPEIHKFVIKDGTRIYAPEEGSQEIVTVAVKSGDKLKFCAEVNDVKQTGDLGVGVKTVYARFTPLDDPELVWDDKEQAYCIEKTAGKCGRWHYEVKAKDLLNNEGSWQDGIEVIIDNVPPIGEVLNPHAGNSYYAGKIFPFYAPAVDFGGNHCDYWSCFATDMQCCDDHNCPASGVDYCDVYAIDYKFENLNQSQIKECWGDLWKYFQQVGANPYIEYIGRVPYEDGVCKGYLTISKETNLTDTVFMAVNWVDKAGNERFGLALNPWHSPITMNMEEMGFVNITEMFNSPVTSNDLLNVKAMLYESGLSGTKECKGIVEKYDGENNMTYIISYTGDVTGNAVDGYKCILTGSLPDFSEIQSGEYRYTVEYRLNDGWQVQVIGSDWFDFIVDNARPTMGVIAPQENKSYGELLPISLHVEDESGIVDEMVKFRVHELGTWGNLWCLLGCEDSGWIQLTKQENGLYSDLVNLTQHDIKGNGRYNFDAIACDVLYFPDLDPDNEIGVDMNLDRNTMHCKQISLHGASPEERTACNDGLDNDMDGHIDLLDRGCENAQDNDETDPVAICGNGVVEPGEICDDGQNNGNYSYCNADCTGMGPYCGDGSVNGPEECENDSDCSEGYYCGSCVCQGEAKGGIQNLHYDI
jgi:cysteine-rich repeat protein